MPTIGFGDSGTISPQFAFDPGTGPKVYYNPGGGPLVEVGYVTATGDGTGDGTASAPLSNDLWAVVQGTVANFEYYPGTGAANPNSVYNFAVSAIGATALVANSGTYCADGEIVFAWDAARGATGYILKDGGGNVLYSGTDLTYTHTTPDLTGDETYTLTTQWSASYEVVTETEVTACACGLSLSPATRTVDDEAQTGLTVALTTTFGTCEWTAASGEAWLTITAGAAGTGDGTITYDVAAYDGETNRQATITATATATGATDTHVLTQTPCTDPTEAFASVVGVPIPARSRRQESYRHTQGSPATVWTINHNLGRQPAIEAYDGSGQPILGGTISHVSLNQATLTFATALSGSARCS